MWCSSVFSCRALRNHWQLPKAGRAIAESLLGILPTIGAQMSPAVAAREGQELGETRARLAFSLPSPVDRRMSSPSKVTRLPGLLPVCTTHHRVIGREGGAQTLVLARSHTATIAHRDRKSCRCYTVRRPINATGVRLWKPRWLLPPRTICRRSCLQCCWFLKTLGTVWSLAIAAASANLSI